MHIANQASNRLSRMFPVASAMLALILAGCSGGGSSNNAAAIVPQSTTDTQSTTLHVQSVSSAHIPPTQIGWSYFGTLNSSGYSAKTLLSATGSPLHGAVVQTDSCANLKVGGGAECGPSAQEINNLRFYGLNAIHIYAEDFEEEAIGNPVGVNAQYIDSIVDTAAQNGIYVIITPGNSHSPTSFNLQFVKDFWNFYASRYANAQNVIFEIMNEPQDSRVGPQAPNTGQAYSSATLQMEADAYNVIRSHAASNPVLFMSYPFMFSKSLVDRDLAGLEQDLGIHSLPNNTGIAFHGYGSKSEVNGTTYALQSEGLPLVDTEFHNGTAATGTVTQDVDETNDHNLHSVSWMTFLTVKPGNFSILNPDTYEDPLRAAHVSWQTSYYNVSFPYIVPNFAFSAPELSPGSYAYDPAGTSWTPAGSGATLGWTFSGTSGITSATGSGFTWANPAPPAGINDVAFIQNQGAMWQTFTDLAPNTTYTLGFWEAARNYGTGGNAIIVSVDHKQVASFAPASLSYAPFFCTFTTNSSNLHTLTFQGQNAQGDETTFIGSVSITP